MPVTSSAKKALRRDLHRTQVNRVIRTKIKTVLIQAKETNDQTTLQDAYSILDRAAKVSVIHKNKAARLKSQVAKNVAQKQSTPKSAKKTATKTTKIKKTTLKAKAKTPTKAVK